MDYRIVYRDDAGRLIVVTPATGSGLTIEEVAERDVPAGSEYHIFPADELPQPPLDEALAAERAGMQCSPLQGRLALGEAEWSRVEAMLADPETPWAMRQVIASASVWQRLSPMIEELSWLMGYDDEHVDGLFRAAMQIEA